LLMARSTSSAFDPHGGQKVVDVDKRVFAILRTSPDGSNQVLCLQNVTAQEIQIQNPLKKTARDLLTNRSVDLMITLKPYQSMWLEGSSR
jgi:glucosylglycerate phosphorylase